MASSLMALLSQQSQNLQTRKGLIVLGLQNDFISPQGKLPVSSTGFVDRLSHLIPAFREHGDIVWVRSEYESTRPVNGFDTPGDTVVAGGSSGQEPQMPSSTGSRKSGKDRSPVATKKRKVTSNTPRSVMEQQLMERSHLLNSRRWMRQRTTRNCS